MIHFYILKNKMTWKGNKLQCQLHNDSPPYIAITFCHKRSVAKDLKSIDIYISVLISISNYYFCIHT